MRAHRFIGRVGGLALALGVGTGVLAGHGIAYADDGSADRSGKTDTTSPRAKSAVAEDTRDATAPRKRHPALNRPAPTSAREPKAVAHNRSGRADLAPAVEPGPVFTAEVPLTAEPQSPDALDRTPIRPPVEAAPLPAPAAAMSQLTSANLGDALDPLAGGGPGLPLTSPLEWALLGFARREAAQSAADTGSPSAAAIFGNSITVDEQLGWNTGVLQGALNATSARGLPLTYSVVADPNLGGKVSLATQAGLEGQFSYLPYMTTLADPTQTETFRIMVAETTPLDEFLKKLPLIGVLADPVLDILHRTPILSSLLAPLIGAATVVGIDATPAALAAGRPTAFTYKMPSFDGTLISLNYYPSVDVATGVASSAPTIFNGPDLGFPGNTDIYSDWAPSLVNIVPGLAPLREGASPFPGGYVAPHGFNVITWDPRGEWASGGVMQLDSPFYEARDVSSMISWSISPANIAAGQVATDAGDPLVGMVGGSYGGGIQLNVAATDPRMDAIIPGIAWNTLTESLYPDNVFKTVIGSELLMALVGTGARINSTIYGGILTGALFSWLGQNALAVLTNAGPGILSQNITAPSMFLQGTVDILFELDAANTNAQLILGNHPQVPITTTWFCGGHGVCLLPQSLQAVQGQQIMSNSLQWIDQYVAGTDTPIGDIPAFQWYDQKGQYHASSLNPFDPAFNKPTPLTYTGPGGGLLLVPLLGGSGPSDATVPPDKPSLFSGAFALASGSRAWNALNVTVTPPVGTEIVGAPTLSFTYQGLGISRAVYAQLVDNATGQVVGNIVTPVPVTLDGRQRTVQIPLADIAYTVGDPGDSMTLQITSSALPYIDFTDWGGIGITDITLDLPIVA